MMHRVSAAVLTSVLLCVATARSAALRTADLSSLFPPDSTLAGWELETAPTEYGPETLYLYLDGGAERFLSYGFRRLFHARYELDDGSLAGVTLDVFDMGTDLGAFGIYRSGLSASALPRAWGAEGYRSGVAGGAWKGRIYVHAVAEDDRSNLIAMVEHLLGVVSAGIPGDASLPAMLELFPKDCRVPRSERYVASNLLGHAFLSGGFTADYVIGQDEVRLFVSVLGREDRAIAAMAQLRAHQARRGEGVRENASIGADGFRFHDPILGNGTVFRAGSYVVGGHGVAPDDTLDHLLGQLLNALASVD